MSKKKEISSDKSSENQSPGRRDALKKILVGAGVVTGSQLLPDEWTKPIVDSIIVPAHAQSSGDVTPAPGTTSSVPVSPTPPPGSTTPGTPPAGTTSGVPVSPTPPPG